MGDLKVEVSRQRMLDEKEISLIRKAVVKETFKNGCLMALVFVGFMLIYTALKTALNYGWQIDLLAGLLLFVGGLQYVWKKLRWEANAWLETPARFSDST